MKIIKKFLTFVFCAVLFFTAGKFPCFAYCESEDNSELDDDEATVAYEWNEGDDGSITIDYGDDHPSYFPGESNQDGETVAALRSLVNEAAQALDEALASGNSAAIAAAQAAYDEAKSALDEFCASHPNYTSIYDSAGFVTTVNTVTGMCVGKEFIGDPVKLSTGDFTIQDADLETNFFGKQYKISRVYRTKSNNDGVFGFGWTSNLDMRLLHCTVPDMSACIDAYKESKIKLDEIREEFNEFLDEEEESPESIMELQRKFFEIYNNGMYNMRQVWFSQQRREFLKPLQRYTAYGQMAEAAEKMGNSIVLIADESGVLYAFEEENPETGMISLNSARPVAEDENIESEGDGEDENESEIAGLAPTFDDFDINGEHEEYIEESRTFYPVTKNLYFEKLEYDAENQNYILYCTNGEKIQFDKFGLHKKTEYNNGVLLEKKYDFDSDENIRSIEILINEKKLYKAKFNSEQKIVELENLAEKFKYSYNADGTLASVTDNWNNRRSFDYDENKFLVKQIFADGTFRSIKYDEKGMARSVTDENGNSEFFDYDTKNRITYYTDRDGIKSTYFYDENSNTTKEVYADGDISTFEYDEKNKPVRRNRISGFETLEYDERGRILKIVHADGKTTEYAYDGENLTALKDRDNVKIYFGYDKFGNMTSLSNENGIVFTATFYENGLLKSRTDARNNTSFFDYDANGNMTKKTIRDSNGVSIYSEEKFYDAKNRILKIKKSDGSTTNFSYGDNNAISIMFSNGLKVEYEYNKRGRLVRQIESDTFTGKKRESVFTYDKAGNIIEKSVNGKKIFGWSYTKGGSVSQSVVYNPVFDESKNYGPKMWQTDFEFDSVTGKVSAITESKTNGKESPITSQTSLINFEKNSNGLQSTFIFDDGRKILNKYNDNGKLVEKLSNTLKDGSASTMAKSVYKATYSSEGRMVSETMPYGFGGEYIFGYDGFGRLAKSFENGESESGILNENNVEFFADGLIASTTDSSGLKTTITYDGLGNVIEAKNKYSTAKNEFAGENRPAKKEIYDAVSGKLVWKATFKYGSWKSEKERWIEATIGDKIKTKMYFDAWGELVSKTDAFGNKTTYEYDAFGNCVKTTFPSGVIQNVVFDGRGFAVEKTISGKSDAAVTETYEYDFNGNLICIRNGKRIVYKAKYNSTNKIVFESSSPFSKYSARNYEYDEFGKLSKITLGDESVPENKRILLERYEYTDSNSPKMIRYDAKGNKRIVTLDKFGRILAEKNRLGDSQSFSYKTDGTISGKLDFENQKISLSGSVSRLETAENYFDGTFTQTFFNSMGNVIRTKNEESDFVYKYDTSGLLECVRDEKKGIEVLYFYDAAGRKTEIKGDNIHVKYFYSEKGFLSSVVDVKERSEVKFVYDDLGREILKIWSDGKSQKYLYDEEGRRTATCVFDANLQVIFFDGAVYNDLGFQTVKLDASGAITQFEYDEFGRLSKTIYPYSENFSKYIQSELSENGIFFSTINFSSSIGEGRLSLSQKEKSDSEKLLKFMGFSTPPLKTYENTLFEKFKYDDNGNIIAKETPFAKIVYKYDAENRLVEAGNTGASVYDKNGNLVSQKTSWKTKYFDYNAQNRVKKAGINDMRTGETVIYNYSYDGFGRRLEEVSTRGGGTGRRFFYDGLTLKKLYSSPIIFSSTFESSGKMKDSTRALRSEQSSSSSDRYAWFHEKESGAGKSEVSTKKVFDGYNRYIYGNDASPLMSFSEGSISVDNGNYSMFSDLGGSVRKISNESGSVYSANFTSFGSLFETDFPTSQKSGFIGKEYNSDMETFDFGYRDYDARQGRFQTVDPIRDGENWYMYCGGNPISFFDPNGLWLVRITSRGLMQDHGKEPTINGTSTTIYKEGCVCQSIATIINTFAQLTGDNYYTALDIANSSATVFSESRKADIIIDATLRNYGLEITEIAINNFNSGNEIKEAFARAKESDTAQVVMGKVATGFTTDWDGLYLPDHYLLIEDIIEKTFTREVPIEYSFLERITNFFSKDPVPTTRTETYTKSFARVSATSKFDKLGIVEGLPRWQAGWELTDKKYIDIPLEMLGKIMSIKSTDKFYEIMEKNLQIPISNLNTPKSCSH